jgi:hypothetical protein
MKVSRKAIHPTIEIAGFLSASTNGPGRGLEDLFSSDLSDLLAKVVGKHYPGIH